MVTLWATVVWQLLAEKSVCLLFCTGEMNARHFTKHFNISKIRDSRDFIKMLTKEIHQMNEFLIVDVLVFCASFIDSLIDRHNLLFALFKGTNGCQAHGERQPEISSCLKTRFLSFSPEIRVFSLIIANEFYKDHCHKIQLYISTCN